VKLAEFNTDDEVLIIAEIGNNHEGNFDLALRLIDEAAEAGVQAVKFQTFIPEHYSSQLDTDRITRLKGFQLSFKQFEQLADYAKNAGQIFISTPFDLESARFLGGIADGIKIASGDNTFGPLIKTVAETTKPMIVSTGLADIKQVQNAAKLIQDTWSQKGCDADLAILHCVASYPVPADEANLSAIPILATALNNATIGYSDHTLGVEAPVLAVALGARIVEKHFTIDNNYSDFRDHQVSANPNTLKEMVKRIKDTEAFLGSGTIGMEDCEQSIESAIRRSIVAVNDLSVGHTISDEDITWVRPGGGIPPGEEDRVLGKILSRAIAPGEMILSTDVA
jgi:N,N'-diacetyllegionaminate synthase